MRSQTRGSLLTAWFCLQSHSCPTSLHIADLILLQGDLIILLLKCFSSSPWPPTGSPIHSLANQAFCVWSGLLFSLVSAPTLLVCYTPVMSDYLLRHTQRHPTFAHTAPSKVHCLPKELLLILQLSSQMSLSPEGDILSMIKWFLF